MSHRDLETAATLRRLLAEADGRIAEAKLAAVVDFRSLADLKRRRETLHCELQAAETRAEG